ncbi:unnamed protein product [Chondrus crispus]|uniref:E2F/DP family winged-helix DNA-binding domain-containing protein n=1 Tax=Chondrus crispus TaxID=2769 RepID=R7QB65_CHOCR|nr:unnamed protein product [Chondrus crispus]CDF34710.1 unnamed protein product [Chondrus crispus]|eukprot:XP_005714529.1 unnamed protein product [Chondrus crispus]
MTNQYIKDLPRLPPAPTSPKPKGKPRDPALPPKLGIKKRKPRPNSVVSAANHRFQSPAPSSTTQSNAFRPPPVASAPTRRTSERAKYKPPETEAKRKGLRHFAVRVSRKVEQKVVTTYNEVADELVNEETMIKKQELSAGGPAAAGLRKKLEKSGNLVDEKNIRRRVYDSLNVLMAMGIIEKEKKLITWQGLAMAQSARGNGEITAMKAAVAERRQLIEEKARILAGIKDQCSRTDLLIERNKDNAKVQDFIAGPDNLLPVHHHHPDRIGLPFVVFVAPKDATIECQMDKLREDVSFTFDSTFQIFDEKEILRRMDWLSTTSPPISEFNEHGLANHLFTSPSQSHPP